MNEIAQEHFKYTESRKRVRILNMNETQKPFAPFLHCTR
jgi:hypothetical protein